MSDFDPDAFLAKRQAAPARDSGFDPDAFLKQRSEAAKVERMRSQASAAREAAQRELVDGMSWGDKLLTGIGGGMVNVAQNVGDIVGGALGIDAIRPDAEKWAEQKAAMAPLEATGWGAAGKFVGETAATLPAGLGVGKAASALGSRLLPRAVAGVAPYAGMAAEGATQSTLVANPEDRRSAALFGAALAPVLPLAARGFNAAKTQVPKLLQRSVAGADDTLLTKPTTAAKALMDRGVKLTRGQQQPESLIGGIEQSSLSVPGVGDMLRGQRRIGERGWQDLVVSDTMPIQPAPLMSNLSMAEKASRLKDAYKTAYDDVLKGVRIDPELHQGNGIWKTLGGDDSLVGSAKRKGAFELATQNKQIMATQATRDAVNDFLQNQLTMLPKKKGGTVPADMLLQMRGNIRKAVRDRLRGSPSAEDAAAAQMLKSAEEAIDNVFEARLPQEARDRLRSLDSNYVNYKNVMKAIAKGQDGEGFTPAQLERISKQGGSDVAVATGEYGGDTRDAARLGREVFDISKDRPPTGARLLGVPIPSTQTIGGLIPGRFGPGQWATYLNDAAQRAANGTRTPSRLGRFLERLPTAPNVPTTAVVPAARGLEAYMQLMANPVRLADEKTERQEAYALALRRKR